MMKKIKTTMWHTLACVCLTLGLALPALAEDVALTDVIPNERFRRYLKEQAYTDNKAKVDAAIEAGTYTVTGGATADNPFNKDTWTDVDFEQIKIIKMQGFTSVTSLEGVKRFVNLEQLNVINCRLTTLDVSGLKHLVRIWCERNGLTYLNFSGAGTEIPEDWGQAKFLRVYAQKNKLTAVKLDGCTTLDWLEIWQNQIKLRQMYEITLALPPRKSPTVGILRVYNRFKVNDSSYPEGNQLTNQVANTIDEKGWNSKEAGNNSDNPTSFPNFTSNIPTPKYNLYEIFPDSVLVQYIINVAYLDNRTRIVDAINSGNYYPSWSNRQQDWESNPFFSTYLDDTDLYWIRELRLNKWNYEIRDEETGEVTRPARYVRSLEGIKNLYNLEHLYVQGHSLEDIDVSGMDKLRILHCQEQLKAIDAGSTLIITDPNRDAGVIREYTWQVESGGLTSLNVEGCDSLFQIYCDHNLLEQLDVTSLDSLKMLRCNNNPIGSNGLDVTQNTALNHLDCYNCRLEELDVTKNPKLEILYCYETRDNEYDDDGSINGTGATRRGKITTLDLSKNPVLKELRCSNNPLRNLDLSRNPLLEILYVNSIDMMTSTGMSGTTNMLQKNLQYTPALKQLSCYNANLDALDVSGNTNLWELICYKNNIKWLSLDNNTALTYLSTGEAQEGPDLRNANNPNGGNPIRRLDVSKLTGLKTLHCAKMQLTDLDLSKNTALEDLDYQIQERTVQAEHILIDVKENNQTNQYNVYYMRMDKKTTDDAPGTDLGGRMLADRIIASDYQDIEGYEPSSDFDISLVDMNSWSNGTIINGSRGSSSSRRGVAPVATSDKLIPANVIGDILVFEPDDVKQTETQATGKVTYKYNVQLPTGSEATDAQTEFTLNWYSDPRIITAVEDITAAGEVGSVTYVSVTGQVSATPWTGINLVITRYTNGTSTTEKRLF